MVTAKSLVLMMIFLVFCHCLRDENYSSDHILETDDFDEILRGEDFDQILGSDDYDAGDDQSQSQSRFFEKKSAVCVISIGSKDIYGSVVLEQNTAEGPVTITGEITGLRPDSTHGFHVHEKGDVRGSKPCDTTGAHFNPFNKDHGAPDAQDRHVGDLGNIVADSSGKATVNIVDRQISLNGKTRNILGRAFVLHANKDDLGLGGKPLSNTTGDAGARVACGVIGIL